MPLPDPLLLGGLLVPAVAAFLAAVFLKDFVRAVIAYAVGTAILAGVFALLGATLAAVLELTAGAGLVSVLFLVAITLTQGREEEAHG